MTMLTVTEARSILHRRMNSAADSHDPALIQGNSAHAVLMSEVYWNATQEIRYLLGIPGMRESLREGMDAALEQCPDDAGLVMWTVLFTDAARHQTRHIANTGLPEKTERSLEILKEDPFAGYPRHEKLVGDLHGAYSRSIGIRYRLVSQIFPEECALEVQRQCTHHE